MFFFDQNFQFKKFWDIYVFGRNSIFRTITTFFVVGTRMVCTKFSKIFGTVTSQGAEPEHSFLYKYHFSQKYCFTNIRNTFLTNYPIAVQFIYVSFEDQIRETIRTFQAVCQLYLYWHNWSKVKGRTCVMSDTNGGQGTCIVKNQTV